MQHQPPAWLDWLFNHPPYFFLFFLVMWALTLYALGMISGWVILSKRFRFKGSFYGETWPFRSARMRFYLHYGNCLSVGADESGLYLAILPFFRFGHPPLLIPWSEVRVMSGESGLISKKRELRLGQQESIPLRLSASLTETLRQQAGKAWPFETVAP